MNTDLFSLKQIIERSFSRYIKVLPNGFQLPHEPTIYNILNVSLSHYHPARTFYQNKKPFCRSLDGIKSLKNNKKCVSCVLQNRCTPQICIELLYQDIPLKLLIAYTSMRKFLKFISKTNIQRLKNDVFIISVINRGKWGELHFSCS